MSIAGPIDRQTDRPPVCVVVRIEEAGNDISAGPLGRPPLKGTKTTL